eukprot:CAMPEP_0194146906 /NCGR_PEP_ID=MMETSP0152-20130528/22359_1 /TAXON_ID=1049557 /ORGANISM="Thalassiothrix antarctica, Strain L6-D1" /LENGTH=327 /DNA_ID=CAMNT_0038847563 /DNA_START=32 /DNA_END=1015 /DNA_ORIENTATION=-
MKIIFLSSVFTIFNQILAFQQFYSPHPKKIRYSVSVTQQKDDDYDEQIMPPTNDNNKPEEKFKMREGSTGSSSRNNSELSTEQLMLAMGTSPRRIFLSLLSATGIALAGNLFGVTSQLLTLVPEDTVAASGLDTYFPRGDFKRCREESYSFLVPKEWVADTTVALAKAQRNVKPMDFEMKRRTKPASLPDSAYGPPGNLNKRGFSEQGDTNVSVIVSSNLRDFSLRETLGSPKSAAETFLRLSLAPEGSGKTATLLNAEEDTTRSVYQFEYDIDRGQKGPPLRAISVIAARNSDTLITLTVIAPKEDWGELKYARKLRRIAESFRIR